MAIKNKTVDEYVTGYSLPALKQLVFFGAREPENADVQREVAKIKQAIELKEA